MTRAFRMTLFLTSMVMLQGCTPMLIAGGLVALSTIDQEIKKQEYARKVTLEQQARLQRENQEQERVRQEELTRQRAEELRRQQLAEAQRRQREEDEQRRATELAKQRQTDAVHANALLANIESELNAGRWNKQRLPAIREAVSAAGRSTAPDAILARLHMATGLYAYLSGDETGAEKEWTLARQMGVREAHIVASDVWTPGAVEAFAHAARN